MSSAATMSAAQVESVVLEFYRTGGISGSQGASGDSWLTSAQSSPSAWQFAFELVDVNKSPEVQFFGANTIVIKVSKHFHEVPASDFPSLQQRLLGLLNTYLDSKGPKIVLTRLCVAVAHLVIQGSSTSQWQNPVEQLMNMFQAEMEKRGVGVLSLLLELLTIIPEEFATSVMSSTSKRAVVRAELTKTLPLVVDIIRKVFNEQGLPTDVQTQAMKCLQAWVQFGVPNEVTEELFFHLLMYLNNEELYETALDAMAAVVSHPTAHKYPATMRTILAKVVEMDTIFYRLMSDENFEYALPLASFFITFGESHSRIMIEWALESEAGRAATVRLVNIVLAVSVVPAQYPTHETLSEMPFGFWYIFQDDIIAGEPQEFQQCVAVYGPLYAKLVEGFIMKSMYPVDDSQWTKDQKEAFRCYRTDIGDTLLYCYNILRDNLLNLLLSHLDAAISKANANHAANWPYLEACLFAWSAIGECLAEEEECPQLQQFLTKIVTVPYNNNVKVITSAMDSIGAFSEMLYGFPDLLSRMLPIVLSAIQTPELSLCSTMALKDITRDCTEIMGPFAQDVLSQCKQALSSNRLKNAECIRLMFPIGKMLSLIQHSQIMPHLQQILSPYITGLQEISSAQQDPSPAATKVRLVFIFKLLTSLFQSLDIAKARDNKSQKNQNQSLNQTQPLTVLYPQLLPLIKNISYKYTRDCDVMDAVWTFIKQVTTCLAEYVKPFTQETVELMAQSYSAEPHETALELAKTYYTLLGKDPECQGLLVNLFGSLMGKTLQHVQSTGNMSDHSELISTFFSVHSSMIKKDARIFESPSIPLKETLQCACAALSIPESGAVRSAASFLANFLVVARESQTLFALANQIGEAIFRQVMTCIGGPTSNKSFIENFVEVLLALSKKYYDNLVNYMNTFVNESGFPSDKISAEQKHHYAQLILKERPMNKRRLLEITRELSLVCAGMSASEDMNRVMAAWDKIDSKQSVGDDE